MAPNLHNIGNGDDSGVGEYLVNNGSLQFQTLLSKKKMASLELFVCVFVICYFLFVYKDSKRDRVWLWPLPCSDHLTATKLRNSGHVINREGPRFLVVLPETRTLESDHVISRRGPSLQIFKIRNFDSKSSRKSLSFPKNQIWNDFEGSFLP